MTPYPDLAGRERVTIECDCEPTVYDDGSIGHEQDCAVYPWCPHEVAAYSCLMPCGCPCGPCKALGGVA